MDFQNKLTELRTERGLSQEGLAEKIYVSRQTISNWERGKTYPDINSLLLIATYFDVSLDHLIKGDVDEMKHQVEHAQLKKCLILSGIFFFIFSVIFPLRYLVGNNLFLILFSLTVVPLLFSSFQVFHILSNRKLTTFTDILNFLEGRETPFKLSREIWLYLLVYLGAFLIFFVGNIVSALIFWLEWL